MNASKIDQPDEATSGPILIQSLLQYLCQGVILSQGVKFWSRCADDSLRLRLYVTTLVVFSVLQTALETYKVWLEVIVREHWFMSPLHSTEFLINGLICTLCEIFLIRRCWKATEKTLWVLVSLASLSIATFVANIYLAVDIGRVIGVSTGYADPLKVSDWAFPLWVYASLVLSLALTSILSVSLWRRKTGLNYLDKMVKHIIALTWESAALPTIAMILAASLYSSKEVTTPRHLDLFFILLTGKLYTLGILRTINSRVIFRERLASADHGRTSLSDYKWDQPSSNVSSSTPKPLAPDERLESVSVSPPSGVLEEGENSRGVTLSTALQDDAGDILLSHRDQRPESCYRCDSSHVSVTTLP